MKIKKGFVLREVCGEHVIVGEGLGAVNFGKLLALNERHPCPMAGGRSC